jgi:hypothetical protein
LKVEGAISSIIVNAFPHNAVAPIAAIRLGPSTLAPDTAACASPAVIIPEAKSAPNPPPATPPIVDAITADAYLSPKSFRF